VENLKKEKKVKNKRFHVLVTFLIAGVLCTLSACSEKAQPPVQKKKPTVQKVDKTKVKKSVEKEPPQEVVAYRYEPMGKKDPFKPLVSQQKKITDKILMKGPLTPLQKYVLSDLILVAIVIGLDDDNKAMVEDSKGDGYIISKGTLIGDKYGEVIEIKSNEVIIMEKEIDPTTGNIIQKENSLILYRPEEEEL